MIFEPIQTVLSIKNPKKQIKNREETVFGYKYMLAGHLKGELCVVEITEQDNGNVLARAGCANPIEVLKQLADNLLCQNKQKSKENLKPLFPEHNSHDCDLHTCNLKEWVSHGFGFISYRYDETIVIFKAETGERFGSIMFVSGKSSRNITRIGKSKTFEEALKLAFPTEII
jgi:hypothetical protein